jgi:hypothetical protein
MPDPAIRMVNEDVEQLSRDAIQGQLTASPLGSTPVHVTLRPITRAVKSGFSVPSSEGTARIGLVLAFLPTLLPASAHCFCTTTLPSLTNTR